jgi:DNA-binding NarL/FixJ family response regulator
MVIGRPEITSIRMLLAVDSDVIRRVLSDFLRDEPLIEIVGEAKDFTGLLEKVLALKPRIVLMDLHLRDEYKFKPEFEVRTASFRRARFSNVTLL